MDITSPINLWKDYDVSALPLNVSELSPKTENDITVKRSEERRVGKECM